MTSSAGISTDKIQEGEKTFLKGLSEEKLKEIVADAAKEIFADYYRRGYPGFEITSGGDTTAHGVAEYCMTTDTIQGLHFYKQGNMKMRSNKSMEFYTGESEDVTDGSLSFKIHTDGGNIVIEANGGGDITLRGRNITLQAGDKEDAGQIKLMNTGQMVFDSGEKLHVEAGGDIDILSATNTSIFGNSACDLHCRSAPVTTSSGADNPLAGGLMDKIMLFTEKWNKFFGPF
tara:strand:- start:2636 stop:3328 length:693 start_codon:yes stop_codon:yes gene_type:complete